MTPSMHLKRTEHEECCMQDNQLSIKTSVELKNNSKTQNKIQ
jgi:hypothetical protein